MVRMVIHIGDGEFCITYVTDQDMETIEIFDIALVAMSNTVLMQAIGERSWCNGVAFLLAIAAEHERILAERSERCMLRLMRIGLKFLFSPEW